jgi:hypothetical protein
MAQNGGLPAWVGAWVGKVVQVYVHGDPRSLVRRPRGLGRAGRGAAPYGGHGPPHRLSRRGHALGPDDDPRNLVGGALRLGTAGRAREGLAPRG